MARYTKKELKDLLYRYDLLRHVNKETIKEICSGRIIVLGFKKHSRSGFTGVTIDEDGIIFYVDGLKHRETGPAMILKCGSKIWYRNNLIHRDHDSLPAEMRRDTMVPYNAYYQDGKLHRENGPAIIFSGSSPSKEWFKNNIRHREDGPAIITKDKKLYFLRGQELKKKEFKRIRAEEELATKEKELKDIL